MKIKIGPDLNGKNIQQMGIQNPIFTIAEVAVFRADHLLGYAVRWHDGNLLEISYEEARIYHYQNYWYHAELDDYRYVVQIAINPRNPLSVLGVQDQSW